MTNRFQRNRCFVSKKTWKTLQFLKNGISLFYSAEIVILVCIHGLISLYVGNVKSEELSIVLYTTADWLHLFHLFLTTVMYSSFAAMSSWVIHCHHWQWRCYGDIILISVNSNTISLYRFMERKKYALYGNLFILLNQLSTQEWLLVCFV